MAQGRGSGSGLDRRGHERVRGPRLLFAGAESARLRQGNRSTRREDFRATKPSLRALAGVGAYTAAAIAAIAFGRQTTPVDGNIARILARLLALERPIARARAELATAARALAPSHRAGDFAQAIMDIGATLCRPRNPACGSCPLADDCAAFRAGVPEAYPRRAEAKARPRRQGAVFFARRSDGAFLARRRPPHGLLASTIELPGTPWTSTSADGEPATPLQLTRFGGGCREMSSRFSPISLSGSRLCRENLRAAPRIGCFWVKPDAVGAAGFSSMMRKAVKHALTQA